MSNHDQNRIRSVLGGNIEKSKQAATLLLTLPGSPFIYYGEELGMLGEKPDEQIREPFIWNVSTKDSGQTNWEEIIHNTSDNTAALVLQQKDANSLWQYYKNLIHLRKANKVLAEGALKLSNYNNENDIIAFIRSYKEKEFLILLNIGGTIRKISIKEKFNILLNKDVVIRDNQFTLQRYSSIILELKTN